MILCLLAEWGAGGAAAAGAGLVADGVVPRVAVEEERGRVWADVRGLPVERVASTCVRWVREHGGTAVRYGVGRTAVGAWARAWAAGTAGNGREEDRSFLSPLPLTVLEPDEKLLTLLEGVGVETCGGLAALDREAVEVRFGAEAVRVWRLARANDDRRLFRPAPRETPQASLDFIDYVVTDPERLLFTANALLANVCEALAESGAHTRRMTLTLSLANGDRWSRSIGAARATASRTTWLRRVRAELERLTVPDAVTGVVVAAETAEDAGAVQGDLFDAGFATAAAVDDALERLVEVQGPVVVEPDANGHALAERRSAFGPAERYTTSGSASASVSRSAHGRSPWREEAKGWRRRRDPAARTGAPQGEQAQDECAPVIASGFTLQLLPEPRRIHVETIMRRDHIVPVRYRDGTWRALLTAAGPDRVSGGQWESAYAREYYRCVDGNGLLVWIYRDGRDGEWYLHGWWD